MNYKTVLVSLSAIILLSGCSDESKKNLQTKTIKEPLITIKTTTAPQHKEVTKSVIKKDYAIDEIYNSMCITCHSSDGSGNSEKLTPSMSDLTQEEMLIALKDVEADKGHIIMDHNREEILKMGMEYKAEDMARYMFERFNK